MNPRVEAEQSIATRRADQPVRRYAGPARSTVSVSRRGVLGQALDVLAVGRPAFWPVSLLPYYVGILLATHRLVPEFADWPRLAAGAVAIGPLLWLAVLAVNDACDLPGDLLNPRKAKSPLLAGRITPRTARLVSVVAGTAAVTVALSVGLIFSLGILLAFALGWAYSVPPLRLKTRAGFDVAVNALALGAFGPLAGWAAAGGSLDGFPWAMALQGTLVAAALYLPTTLADLAADRAAGYRTIAVRLGPAATYRLGFAAWTAAAGLSVVLAAADHVIPRHMLALEVVMVPVLLTAYRRLIGPRQSFRGIIVLAALFLCPCAAFALTYTGVL